MKNQLMNLIGTLPKTEKGFKKPFRFHQGWWRAFVLGEEQGNNPVDAKRKVCNTFALTEDNKYSNYLSEEAVRAVQEELNIRKDRLIAEPRIWNNLLSSQPLCFNFWGYLKYHLDIATDLIKEIIPDVVEVTDIKFEWRPDNYRVDHSAFDLLIEYRTNRGNIALLGMECKYTDRLNSKSYDKPEYREIFNKNKNLFNKGYEFYIQPKFNQLFRNQLMALDYSNIEGCTLHCGLFCSSKDAEALDIVNAYKDTLNLDTQNEFIILTYEKFIETIQKLEIDWDTRVWTMKLWARYCGLELSEGVFKGF